MGLLDIIDRVKGSKKELLDLDRLPSRGLFYPDDFKIWIKPVSVEDALNYEMGYKRIDILDSINRLKWIVSKYTTLSEGYTYEDIKSSDIIFIFLKIVEMTKGTPIWVSFFDVYENKIKRIKFSEKSFYYYDYTEYLDNYDKVDKNFKIDGFKFTLPSIGIETSLSNFLTTRIDKDMEYYNNKIYKFIYFIGNKRNLEESELSNLISLFNDDISEEDKNTLLNVYDKMEMFIKYLLKTKNGFLIPISNLDFGRVFRD